MLFTLPCHPSWSVLLPAGFNDNKDDLLPAQYPYRALVGALLYLAMWTRPDIAFAVSPLARFQERPTHTHWRVGKHILAYLKGTAQLGLCYSRGEGSLPETCVAGPVAVDVSSATSDGTNNFHKMTSPAQLTSTQPLGFVDASWGEDVSTRRSQSANVFVLWPTRL